MTSLSEQVDFRSRLLNRRFVAYGAAGLAILALLAVFVPRPRVAAPPAPDPTRFGPERYLRLVMAEVVESGAILTVKGESNLVDGARLQISVWADEHRLWSAETTVHDKAFTLESEPEGVVVAGAYDVRATFLLEEQPKDVREALRYQPRRLEVRRPLNALPHLVQPKSVAEGRFKALFDRLNRGPHDARTLDDLEAEALALGQELWIGKQKAALHKLRLAIEEARKPGSRQAFERLLLEAHVLAGL